MSESLKLLVIEDNPADVKLAQAMLPETGPVSFHIESVPRLAEALTRLESKGIDLVLLDLGLPDSQGLQTFHKLHSAVPYIPVIVLTGADDQDMGYSAVRAGAQDYLVKGQVDRSLLVRAARYAVERQKTADALCESEKKYRGLFESSHDAIMTLEPSSWRFTSGNPATVKMFGAKNEEEFISLSPWELSPQQQPDGRVSVEKAKEMIETAVREGSHQFEWTHRRIGGAEFFADVLLTRMDRNGEVVVQATVRDITERKRAEERLTRVNDCFLGFTADPLKNIQRLTALAGETLGSVSALYNRLEAEVLRSVGMWNVPSDFKPVVAPQGHICNVVIKRGGHDTFVVRNLPQTAYAGTDPNVARHQLQTYVGVPVKCKGNTVGALCVVFQNDFIPTSEDKKLMGIIASAIGIEEDRLMAEGQLKQRTLELDHRVRNNLAGLHGLVMAMKLQATDVAAFAAGIENRITAMAHIYKILRDAEWGQINLEKLATSILDEMKGLAIHSNEVAMEGPAVLVNPDQARPIAMILAEWFTNSCKYGAHSIPSGRLAITWETFLENGVPHIRLVWREEGGPPINRPVAPSMGTSLVNGFANRELHGRCRMEYLPTGVKHTLEFPRHEAAGNG